MVLWIEGQQIKHQRLEQEREGGENGLTDNANKGAEPRAQQETSRAELSPFSSLQELYDDHSSLLEGAHRLAGRKKVRPAPRGVLYARQKEWVVSWAGDRFADGTPVQLCGTEDVLTCHVLVLHHTFTRVTALAHFDEYVRDRGLNRFVTAFLDRVRRNHFYDGDGEGGDDDDGEGDWEWEECDEDEEEELDNIDLSEDPIQLHLVGGYNDEAKKAHRLSLRLLAFFSAHTHQFHLRTCCLGEPNTRPGRCLVGRGEPIVGGVGARVADGMPFPADFNRNFAAAAEVDEDLQRTLLLGPSLVRKPNKLKELILKKEDEGFGVNQPRAT